jgi:hypothetical protein
MYIHKGYCARTVRPQWWARHRRSRAELGFGLIMYFLHNAGVRVIKTKQKRENINVFNCHFHAFVIMSRYLHTISVQHEQGKI